MKIKGISAIVVISCCALMAIAQAPDLSGLDIVLRSVPAGPVARVCGSSISDTEFISLYKTEQYRLEKLMGGKPFDDNQRIQLALLCLDTLVKREILYQEAMKRKIEVPEEEVLQAWEKEVELLKKGVAQANDPSIKEEDVLAKMEAKREDSLASLKKSLLIKKTQEAISREQGVAVSDEEVKAFYEKNIRMFMQQDQYHLKHIFLPVTASTAKEDVRKQAEEAVQRIRAGQSFEGVARNMSQAPDKEQGGDLGVMQASLLPPFMVEAAYKLKPGEISDVLESEYGIHIIKMVEYVPGTAMGSEQTAPLIREQLLAQKNEEASNKFCEKIMSDEQAVRVFLELEKNLVLSTPEVK